MARRPTEKQFFEAVGRAVVAWQTVEVTSSALFAALLQAGNEAGARAGFDRIGNFAMRIELLDIAAKYLLATSEDVGDLAKRWEGLRGRLYSASDLRNRLAHSELGEDAQGLNLRPSLFDLSRVDPADLAKGAKAKLARVVSSEQVQAAVDQFEALGDDLYRFREDVRRLKRIA